jgi:hypothetical protein
MAERLNEFNPEASKAQIRRRMLTIARIQGNQYEGAFVPATNFLIAADDRGQKVAGEDEAAELLGDLVALGLLNEWSAIAVGAPRASFRERRFSLTKKGWRLWSEEIPPIPSVADSRFGD